MDRQISSVQKWAVKHRAHHWGKRGDNVGGQEHFHWNGSLFHYLTEYSSQPPLRWILLPRGYQHPLLPTSKLRYFSKEHKQSMKSGPLQPGPVFFHWLQRRKSEAPRTPPQGANDLYKMLKKIKQCTVSTSPYKLLWEP